MQFRVIGANRQTGRDVDVAIEAADAADAERVAGQRGILVSSVRAASSPVMPSPPPILSAAPVRRSRRGVFVASAALILLVAIAGASWAVWSLFLSNRLTPFLRYRPLVPPDVERIVFLNVAKLRGTEAWRDVKAMAPEAFAADPARPFGPDDVQELFVAGNRTTPIQVAVARLNSAELAAQLMRKRGTPKRVGGFDVVAAPAEVGGFVADLGGGMLCLAADSTAMADALSRHTSHAIRPLDNADLRRALEHVQGQDHFVAWSLGGGGTPDVRTAAVGLSVSDSVRLRVLTSFIGERQADDAMKATEDQRHHRPASMPAAAEKLATLIDKADLRRTGSDVYADATWPYADVKDAIAPLARDPTGLFGQLAALSPVGMSGGGKAGAVSDARGAAAPPRAVAPASRLAAQPQQPARQAGPASPRPGARSGVSILEATLDAPSGWTRVSPRAGGPAAAAVGGAVVRARLLPTSETPGDPAAAIEIDVKPAVIGPSADLQATARRLATEWSATVRDEPASLDGVTAVRLHAENAAGQLRPVEAIAAIHGKQLVVIVASAKAGQSVSTEFEAMCASWKWRR
jgi:hypothetical protein